VSDEQADRRNATPDQLRDFWKDAVAHSNARISEALAEGGLDYQALRRSPEGDVPSLRWIVLHMIEEYARHNGHADLLREVIDGEIGE
jgi:ribulose kinase